MRLIHTSDWHFGSVLFHQKRAAEHQAFLRWLIAQIEQHQVDALIVAGDLFDTGSPPSYARELYNRFVGGTAAGPAASWWCWAATTTPWRR
ncbi:Nuclease sbcCD subunit D [Serratia rubidaea]|uniref:Nuclease SbcCD subunit D n=1 Tax=Serratia rubidaea TaxID=61652 RepID=A0A4U9HAL1_SERRU|nr:Nuclease sbcCD subunit D [Serratia rubidaea]